MGEDMCQGGTRANLVSLWHNRKGASTICSKPCNSGSGYDTEQQSLMLAMKLEVANLAVELNAGFRDA